MSSGGADNGITPDYNDGCPWLADKVERTAKKHFCFGEKKLSQLTINEYLPGQGIGSHIGI